MIWQPADQLIYVLLAPRFIATDIRVHIYICAYIHTQAPARTRSRVHTYSCKIHLCARHLSSRVFCVRVRAHACIHTTKRIRSRVCTETGFIVLSTNVQVCTHSRSTFYSWYNQHLVKLRVFVQRTRIAILIHDPR